MTPQLVQRDLPEGQFFRFWKRQPHAINRDQRQAVVRDQIDSAVAAFDGLHDIVHVARDFHLRAVTSLLRWLRWLVPG